MSGEDEALAQILETAGQRADEIREEIASLKEKQGSNAVTVPQLLKGDAIPDVTEPTEVGRPDEADASLQFTVSTPSGERQAPPKTEDGTDVEDPERANNADGSPIQVYVRSSLAVTSKPGTGAQAAADQAHSAGQNSTEVPVQDKATAHSSWQGLYEDMIGKLQKSESMRQQCNSEDVAALLKSAGMVSSVDTPPCNIHQPSMQTPFAVDMCQAAAVAAGALTTQDAHLPATEGALSSLITPSPVHVIDGPFLPADADRTAAAPIEVAEDVLHEHWTPAPAWLVTPEPNSAASSSSNTSRDHDPSHCAGESAAVYDAGAGSRCIVVPASAADLPVQAVLQELDELLNRSRTPTHHHQQQTGQQLVVDRDKAETDCAVLAISTQADSEADVADDRHEEDELVLRWLQGQKNHTSRRNSTSCLLSDEYSHMDRSISASSSQGGMRRTTSVPLLSESPGSQSGNGTDGGNYVNNDKGLKMHQHRKESSADLRDEILAHLRLAAAFREQPHVSNGSSLQPQAAPAAGTTATASAAGLAKPLLQAAPSTVAPETPAQHGVSLVDWVGAGKTPELYPGSKVGAKNGPIVSGFSVSDASTSENVVKPALSIVKTSPVTEEGVDLPKNISKSAQLYQQLLVNVAGCSPKGSGGGSRSRQLSKTGSQQGLKSPSKSAVVTGSSVRSSSPNVENSGKPAAGSHEQCSFTALAGSGASSPLRHCSSTAAADELQHDSTAGDTIKCTACGSPVHPSRSSSNLHPFRTSVHDLSADIKQEEAEASQHEAGRTEGVDGRVASDVESVTNTASWPAPQVGVCNSTSVDAEPYLHSSFDAKSPLNQSLERLAAAQKAGSNTDAHARAMTSAHTHGYAATAKRHVGNHAGTSKPKGYAATASARQSNSYSGSTAGRQCGYSSARQSSAAQQHGRQPMARLKAAVAPSTSIPGAVASRNEAASVPVGAMVTAVSCGQLLAAAAMDQAMGRISGHESLGRPSIVDQHPAADKQQPAACSKLSLSGMLQLERDMEEEALEAELAQLELSSSPSKPQGVFVYRLQPTNEAMDGGITAEGTSPAAAAAAAAAMQTLAACASRRGTRAASLSPNRMSSSQSLIAAYSNRSSSTDPRPRSTSAGVSRSASMRCGSNAGSNSGARVWRPNGSTSTKDESRKLRDYESARSRILGPVAESQGGAAVPVVNSSITGKSSSKAPVNKPSAFGRSNSSPKKPAGARVAAAVAAIQAQATDDASARPVGRTVSVGRAAVTAHGSKLPVTERRAATCAQSTAQSRVAAARSTAAGRTTAAGKGRNAAAPPSPKVQEQGVQADLRIDLRALVAGAGALPCVPDPSDPCSLLSELKGKTQRTYRQSTPGRLQSATGKQLNLAPVQVHQLHEPQVMQLASPTTSQVEEAIQAAQVALLQRRWQISQLRKAMATQGAQPGSGLDNNKTSMSQVAADPAAGCSSTLMQSAAAAVSALRPLSAASAAVQSVEPSSSTSSEPSGGHAGKAHRKGLQSSAFACPVGEAAAKPHLPVAIGPGLNSRKASRSKEYNTRRSSTGLDASNTSGLAPPPWSAPRRVSSSGLTGEELFAYYRRSSATEAAAAAQHAAAGEADISPAVGMQLDAMVRAYNALAKRKNSVDKSIALAALMAQIVAVASGQVLPGAVGAVEPGSPTVDMNAGQPLTSTNDKPEDLAAESSKLDVLGRGVSPAPATGKLDDFDAQHDACVSVDCTASPAVQSATGGCSSPDSWGIPADAFAAAAPEGNGIVVVQMRKSAVAGRLPLLRDTATGKALLAGIDGDSLTVQQAVQWLKVGLTRLERSNAGAKQPISSVPASPTRIPSPHSLSRARARSSRPCSPFNCFAAEPLSDEEEEQQQSKQLPQQVGVQFEMDAVNQLVMVVPAYLASIEGQPLADVQKYTVTGVALPPGSGEGCYNLELVTSAGRHKIELASLRDWAGLLAGLNAMLVLKEQGGASEKVGAGSIADAVWSAAVEGVIV